jgi:hypoxanthine-guanine phosphoribosyltransferase
MKDKTIQQGSVGYKDLELDLKGKRVYIVDDICDTGATMIRSILCAIVELAQEVRVVTLLKRKGGVDDTDFCGFEIGEEWVVDMV